MTGTPILTNGIDPDMTRISEKWALGDTITQGAIQAALMEYRDIWRDRNVGGATRRQLDAYTFIKEYREANGYTPSFEEIKEGLGLASKSSVSQLLRRLRERGLISMMPGRARSIVLR